MLARRNEMMSPTDVDQQFQTFGSGVSNLDRCNRCGAPRSAHGADWTCPPAFSRGASAVPLITGSLLVLAGALLWAAGLTDTKAQATLLSIVILVGVTLLVAGVILARRPR
jgi:hypothetical protein